MSSSFAIVYRFCHTGRFADQRARSTLAEMVTRFAVGGIRFFIVFFLIIFFFNFMPVPFLVLIFIAAQTAAASISVLFSKYFVHRVSVRSLL